MYVMGIDIGSASSKAVILKDGRELAASAVVQAGTGTSGPDRVLKEIFEQSGLKRSDIACITGTGYGRYSLEIADKQVSEISCHAKGIHFMLPNVRTILDIGGQDVKAIAIDENGNVNNFFMNDKCAAGTGRFLDVMARILEIDVSEMAAWDERSQEEVTVSSTCTVFAESEVISLLSQKYKKEDIIRGIHNSVISRTLIPDSHGRRCGDHGRRSKKCRSGTCAGAGIEASGLCGRETADHRSRGSSAVCMAGLSENASAERSLSE